MSKIAAYSYDKLAINGLLAVSLLFFAASIFHLGKSARHVSYEPSLYLPSGSKIDIGELASNKDVVIPIVNRGGGLLSIQRVDASCDCMVTRLRDHQIPAGYQTELIVTILGSKLEPGPFFRVVSLHSNAPDANSLSVEIHGTAKQ